MDEIRVGSWSELNDELFARSWREELGRFRSPLAFRGRWDAADDLATSLMRLGGPFERLETHLLRNFRKYARRHAEAGGSVWDWLALAQHHGLPTRLLDWTFSPYVALHFATSQLDSFQGDAVVWCVDYVAAKRYLPDRLEHLLEREGSDVFTVEMLDQAASSLGDFDRLADETFAVFLEPPSLDDRIVNQAALFSLLSSPTTSLARWLEEHEGLARRVVVPAELKWEVRDKLDQANVTERVRFPGLDGLSRWVARYYSPRAGE